MSSLRDRITTVFTNCPAAVESDKELLKYYYLVFHKINTFQQYVDDEAVPSVESVIRVARRIRERRINADK